jgi:hypothetical protein
VSAPHAPWRLLGECLVGVTRRRPTTALPEGVRRIGGPCVIVAAHYSDSPVGPYLELAVGEPARLGARPGLCITTMVVNVRDARVGGVVNWGFPKELGTLRWSVDGDERSLRWEEGGVVVRGRATGVPLPVLVPLRAVQHRSDGPVVVPASILGTARLGRIQVDVADGGRLTDLGGLHPGAFVAGMRFNVDPARVPAGLTSTLRAPLTAPEAALTSAGQSGA